MTQVLQNLGNNLGTTFSAASSRFHSPGAGGNAGSNYSTETFAQIIWRDAGTFSNLYANIITNNSTTNGTLVFNDNTVTKNQTITITASTLGEFTDTTHSDTIAAGDKLAYKSSGFTTGSAVASNVNMLFAPTTTTNCVSRLLAGGDVNLATGNALFNTPSGGLFANTTEANAQFKNKVSATVKNLAININSNTATTAAVVSRINGASGNLSISISSGTTGIIEDTTNSDSLAVNDLFNTQTKSSSGTTLNVESIVENYLTTSGKIPMIWSNDRATTTVSTSVTNYYPVSGSFSGAVTTEDNIKAKAQLAFTASNMECFLSANTVSATSTVNFRKNKGNGNQTISLTSSTGGYYEDTTHSDSVVATDEIDYQLITGGTGTSLTITNIGILAAYSATVASNLLLTTGF